MTRKNTLMIGALCLLTSGMLHAHGTAHEDESDSAEALVLEQKPWGIGAAVSEATRTIKVSMSDTMRFTPETMSVSVGETVRFVIHNEGAVMHEFVLGTTETNDEHAELMLKFPGMEHDEPYMAHVPPGSTGEIVWTFNQAGTFDFACLIAGHYQAGMVGTITVQPV